METLKQKIEDTKIFLAAKKMHEIRIKKTKRTIESCLINDGFRVNVFDSLTKDIVDGLTVIAIINDDRLSLNVCTRLKGSSTCRIIDIPYRELTLVGMRTDCLINQAITEAVNRALFNN